MVTQDDQTEQSIKGWYVIIMLQLYTVELTDKPFEPFSATNDTLWPSSQALNLLASIHISPILDTYSSE